jgi:hypothetical protein
MWQNGSPLDHVNPYSGNTCWLLEFGEGDRFVVAKYIIDPELGPQLLDLDNKGYISDIPIRHLSIPDPRCSHGLVTVVGNEEDGVKKLFCEHCGEYLTRKREGNEYIYIKRGE